jgi:DNA-binding response OmpR family regulator
VRLGKIMLVCSEACDDVEKCLLAAGCWVLKVGDGQAAVSEARRQLFDAAVVVSTGETMDLAETVFNLRDVNGSMQVIIIADALGINQHGVVNAMTSASVPNVRVLSIRELERFFWRFK